MCVCVWGVKGGWNGDKAVLTEPLLPHWALLPPLLVSLSWFLHIAGITDKGHEKTSELDWVTVKPPHHPQISMFLDILTKSSFLRDMDSSSSTYHTNRNTLRTWCGIYTLATWHLRLLRPHVHFPYNGFHVPGITLISTLLRISVFLNLFLNFWKIFEMHYSAFRTQNWAEAINTILFSSLRIRGFCLSFRSVCLCWPEE